jgi:toxin FitB
VYLIDTNVISETRKGNKANPGVVAFFTRAAVSGEPIYISMVSVGELRRGVEIIRHRGDIGPAERLETWLTAILEQYGRNILAFEADAAQIWGRLRVPDPSHELDKQIAAIALVHDLTLVTRNTADFQRTGLRLVNPFLTL